MGVLEKFMHVYIYIYCSLKKRIIYILYIIYIHIYLENIYIYISKYMTHVAIACVGGYFTLIASSRDYAFYFDR